MLINTRYPLTIITESLHSITGDDNGSFTTARVHYRLARVHTSWSPFKGMITLQRQICVNFKTQISAHNNTNSVNKH